MSDSRDRFEAALRQSVAAGLPLAVFLALAALFLARIGRDPAVLPSPLIGQEAPSFVLPAPRRPYARRPDRSRASPMPI